MAENISLGIAVFIILWFLCGFLTLIATIIKCKLNKMEIFPEDDALQIISGVFILGPIAIYAAIQAIRDKRKRRRENAGWWELKEFGGKY